MSMAPGTKHQMLRDPSRIRSVFAAFDPKKKGSRDILAGIAAGGVGLNALLQAAEEKRKQRGL